MKMSSSPETQRTSVGWIPPFQMVGHKTNINALHANIHECLIQEKFYTSENGQIKHAGRSTVVWEREKKNPNILCVYTMQSKEASKLVNSKSQNESPGKCKTSSESTWASEKPNTTLTMWGQLSTGNKEYVHCEVYSKARPPHFFIASACTTEVLLPKLGHSLYLAFPFCGQSTYLIIATPKAF